MSSKVIEEAAKALDAEAEKLIPFVKAYVDAVNKHDKDYRRSNRNFSGSAPTVHVAALLASVVDIASHPARYNNRKEEIVRPLKRLSR